MRTGDSDLFLGVFGSVLDYIVTDINSKEVHVAVNLGLADALRNLKQFSADANSLAAQVSGTLKEHAGTVAQVKQVHGEVKRALAEVQAELGGITNGGPPLDDTFPPVAAPARLPDAGGRGDPPLKVP